MEARARHRPGRIPREQDNAMTQFDCLVEVARKLKEARAIGEGCSDRALPYFIDMTIVHVCDALGARDARRPSGLQEQVRSSIERRPRRSLRAGQPLTTQRA